MEHMISITQASKILGVTTHTLQRWDRESVLKPAGRSPTNRRLYTESQLREFSAVTQGKDDRKVVAYCRVSSAAQKPDLKNQRIVMEEFCTAKGLANVDFREEIGGGLNFKRKKFISLMDEIGAGQVKTLMIAHKDRLTRFGFDWFDHYAKKHGCEIMVLNQERLSPEQEVVQDLMSIIHCFSSRLYGLRNYRKNLAKSLGKE